MMFQTPAPRGGVPLYIRTALADSGVAFQTPAPRGGVPLAVQGAKPAPDQTVSNPCASGRCSSGELFYAGCLLVALFQTPAPRGGVPLLLLRQLTVHTGVPVSNPCASGRCSSGQHVCTICGRRWKFQTPAPRGGVPLPARKAAHPRRWPCFKPLRLGAVFLCLKRKGYVRCLLRVSNPCA